MRQKLIVGCVTAACCFAFGVGAKEPAKDKLTVRQRADAARAHVKAAKTNLAKGFAVLQDARATGESRRIECVNSALTQMKGLMRLADNNLLELEEAEAGNNMTSVDRSATKIDVVTGKVGNAYRRLRACMGQKEAGVVTGSGPVLLVEPDPDLPNVDPTEGLKDLAPQLETPPSASPFFS